MADADTADAGAATDALGEAAAALSDAREAREALDVPGDRVDEVADAYRDVEELLDRYEERATDWDDFEGYVEFRENLGRRLERLPDDLPHADAFVAANDTLTTGAVAETLSTDDFERAREQLAPARECAAARERVEAARDSYRDARRRVRERREALAERVAALERLRTLGEADLDAPVERLREPIEAYNDAVREAFSTFRSETPSRDLLDLLADTDAYQLVPFRRPPDRLRSFVADSPAGDEPLPRLLEYAGYSRSKLAHYVDDPRELNAAVSTNRTYLRELDAGPLTVSWPPPPAGRLRWRARELVAVVGRFADPGVVARARTVRDLPDREAYDRLRESSVARAELDAEERERLASGAVERDLERARERLAEVEATLEEFPPVGEF